MKLAYCLMAAISLLAFKSEAFGRVEWNGSALKVHPARVSAYPMNQVYPGYQRPVEQTKIDTFVSFDMDKRGELTFIADEELNEKEITILPLCEKHEFSVNGNTLKITVDKPQQFVVIYGKDKHALHVFANPPFVKPTKGDIIYFGPGEHYVGAVAPKSNQTVVIDEGAIVYGSIQVFHAENVKIVGRGIVDCSYQFRDEQSGAAFENGIKAGFTNCGSGAQKAVTALTTAWATNVVVEGITFRDPPRWTVIIRTQSKNVTLDNIKLIGLWRYNADGINMCASEDITVRNSFVRSFDDCIIARGRALEKSGRVTRNILVENCVLWCDWGKCLEVWAGCGDCLIERVAYRNIKCISSDWFVADVTTWYGSANTRIKDILMENIDVDFWGERYHGYMQKNRDDVEFPRKLRDSSMLFMVDVARWGKDIGNQQCEKMDDLSCFDVKYENLTFRNFRCHGKVPPKLMARVKATPNTPLEIKNVKVENMPEELDVKLIGVK